MKQWKSFFWAYSSTEYIFLRSVLLGGLILCYWEASALNLPWMYFVGAVFLVVCLYITPLINSWITVTKEYLVFHTGLKKYLLPWNEVSHVGKVNLQFYGSQSKKQFVFLSKKRINTLTLEKSKIIPQSTGDCVYFMASSKAMKTLSMFMPNNLYELVK